MVKNVTWLARQKRENLVEQDIHSLRLYFQSPFFGADGGYNTDMQRNWHVWRALLILSGLAVAAALPILGSGFVDLTAAKRLQSHNDHASAAEKFESAARRLPWRGDLWEEGGREAYASGSPGDAIRLLERAPQLTTAGWLALGQSYVQTGQLDLAAETYEAALAVGASVDMYAGLAEVQRHLGNVEAERTALENALLLSPEDAAAHYRLGLLLSVSDMNRALTQLQLASQLDEEYTPIFQTLRAAVTLADLSPTEAGRLITLGRGLGLAGEWSLAARAFLRATEADARNAEAWAWLGEAKQHLGQEAGPDLERAVSLDGKSILVRTLRGLYWKRQGNDRAALAEYEAAAAAEPDNPAWIVSLAETYGRLGNLDGALESYQRATQLAPNESLYWRLLAAFSVEYGVQLHEIGLPAAQKAVDLDPEDYVALDVLGSAQLTSGLYHPAQTTLLLAIDKESNYAPPHLHLAMAYLQTGERDAAYRQLRIALELDPDGSTGIQANQMLKQYFP